jgi:CBS domain-containing membrane protein
MRRLLAHNAALLPQAPLGHLGWVRGAVGALLAIAITAFASGLILGGSTPALPMIVAPMGASAVLVFNLPASPLAQPWPVIGGNLVSASAGLLAGMATGSPWLAGGLAVGLSIGGMVLARCLHPPGGGTALLFALGATGAEHWGAEYLVPVLANVLLLAACGWLYNNATGHAWPHRMIVPPARPVPGAPPPFTHEDVTGVLEDWDEMLDVDPDDLLAFIQAVDRQRTRSGRAD